MVGSFRALQLSWESPFLIRGGNHCAIPGNSEYRIQKLGAAEKTALIRQ
jgi:hypothetical protein